MVVRPQHDDQSVRPDRGRFARLLVVSDTSCAFDARDQGLHQQSVSLTPETKDSINEESLMRFQVREQTSVTSPMRHPIMPKSVKRSPW